MKRKSLLLIATGLFIYSHIAIADFYPAHMVDVGYKWGDDVYNTELSFVVNHDPGFPSYYYWAHFFVFKNSTPIDLRYGYTGLQTVGNIKKVIFSIWNATEAIGRGCRPFVEDGTGYQCLIDYDWQEGHTYRFKVWKLLSDSTGDWWGSWVEDVETGKTENIGLIKSAPNGGSIRESWLFDEYFAKVPNCEAMRFASITYKNLRGNFGSVVPHHWATYPQNQCRHYMNIVFNGNDFTVSTPIKTKV